MTLKSKPDGGKLGRFKRHESKLSRCGHRRNIQLWNENEYRESRTEQKGATVSYLKHLCFSEEKKMRFSGEEVVFYRLKIRSKTAIVAEVDGEEI